MWGSALGSHWNCSLAKVTTFPGDSLKTEIGRVSPKTWCTDKCLNAHCLDHWGLFHGTLERCHISTVFTSCGWWRAKIFPIRDSQLARPDQTEEHSKSLVPQDAAVN